MNRRSTIVDVFYSLAMLIIFSLLFTSCASYERVMYQAQFRSQLSFTKWDLNADGNLNKDEFHTGIYKTLNGGSNRFITQDEWKEAYYYFGTYASKGYGNFNAWDANHDNRLSNDEFKKCFSNSRLYSEWDKDSDEKLNKGEFFAGLFDTWDINDDVTLSSYETESWQEAAF